MDRNHGVKSSPIFITNQNIQLVKILSKSLFVFLLLINILSSCAQKNKGDLIVDDNKNLDGVTGLEVATLGSGCFWCIEAVYQTLEGVEKVESGFSGGEVDNPSYRQICTGNTGHAEVCQITFYPEKITYTELLEVFWATHDPTTLNMQGNDVGT
ncbi:MAG: peptide-methionine (S)-S-oxide reductase MsrA, partial [Bacteroidia bacterium]|nr:peptide-methionine (S)-S-oxide reductase MsrA [Bacteroidia bacterium]